MFRFYGFFLVALLASLSTATHAAQPSTPVQPCILVPMPERYAPGTGILMPGMELAATAVKPFTVPTAQTGKDDVSSYWIHDNQSYSRFFNAHISVSGAYDGVTGSFVADVSDKVSYGSTSTTLILARNITWQTPLLGGFRGSKRHKGYPYPKLTDEALKLTRNPKAFRNRYGDYFVGSFQKSARWYVIITLKSSSSKNISSFRSSVSASSDELFSTKVSARFESTARENSVEITVHSLMYGVSLTNRAQILPGLKDIPKLYQSFSKHAKGSFTSAVLYHYSLLSRNIPRSIPVDNKVLSLANKIYSGFRALQSLTDRPSSPRGKREFAAVFKDAKSAIGSIPSNLHVSLKELSKVYAKLKKCEVLNRRWRATEQFYVELKTAKNLTSGDASDKPVWSAGVIEDNPDLMVQRRSFVRTYTAPAGGNLTFRLKPAKGLVICGYRIEAQNKQQWGKFKLTSGGIGKNYLSIYFNRLPFNGLKWKIAAYLVPDPSTVLK